MVETLGEKFKRLQEAYHDAWNKTAGGIPSLVALNAITHGPAFAAYVVNLEAENAQLRERVAELEEASKGWTCLMELLGEYSSEVSDRDLSKADAFIQVWQKQKERADIAEAELAQLRNERVAT